ncbi:TrmH family RNA methyltransferase [Embleya sp. NPDC008237]|uniref:TrmH family RNA methyltransferase n=1 Tax=Embleya sp. NPDC008237 TaxID=3363978 RepID=UPI0036EC86B7
MNPQETQTLALWRAASPGAVLLDGFHAVKHAVRFGAEIELVVTTDRAAVVALADELAADVGDYLEETAHEVSEPFLRELVPRGSPTGVVALAGRPEPEPGRARSAPIVLLENPRNLGNVGAVVRLAAGFGVAAVLTTGDLDPWHPNVVRGSAGLHFATTVARVASPHALPAGPVFVLDPEGADLRDIEIPDDAILAFGTERHGVSAALRERADRLVAIPMRPKVSSYNLATSVAMTLFRWSTTSANAPT